MTYIAIDIGATNIRVAHGNERGLEAKISRRTSRENGVLGISRQLIDMINHLGVKPSSIGIGSIGPIDIKRGEIKNTPNFPYDDIPVLEPIRDEFDVRVSMLNDCSAAVIGEHIFGGGRGVDNLFYVTFSTGLGGGAIVDGHIIKGKDGNVPEIGHIIINPDSEMICGCGGRGHWEAYSSGENIPRYAEYIAEKHGMKCDLGELRDGDETLTVESIFKSARDGGNLASKIVGEIGKVNTIGIADIVNIFDPELISLGGAITFGNPNLILNPILADIDQHIINRKPEIVITPLGEDAVLYGALAMAMERIPV
ncbi:MAG: ROK family protein [Candidatus Bathyarchaeia archaeon]